MSLWIGRRIREEFEINFKKGLFILKASMVTSNSFDYVYDFRSSSEGKFFSLQF